MTSGEEIASGGLGDSLNARLEISPPSLFSLLHLTMADSDIVPSNPLNRAGFSSLLKGTYLRILIEDLQKFDLEDSQSSLDR